MDRETIRETLSRCIDILDTSKHPESGIVNIFSGCVIDDASVNVYKAAEVGAMQQKTFENGLPESFQQKITKKIKTLSMASKVSSKA